MLKAVHYGSYFISCKAPIKCCCFFFASLIQFVNKTSPKLSLLSITCVFMSLPKTNPLSLTAFQDVVELSSLPYNWRCFWLATENRRWFGLRSLLLRCLKFKKNTCRHDNSRRRPLWWKCNGIQLWLLEYWVPFLIGFPNIENNNPVGPYTVAKHLKQ